MTKEPYLDWGFGEGLWRSNINAETIRMSMKEEGEGREKGKKKARNLCALSQSSQEACGKYYWPRYTAEETDA